MTLKRRRRAPRALAAAIAALAVAPAAAQARVADPTPCPEPPLSTPFAPWGDTAPYTLAPGGDVEGSLDGWTLSGDAAAVAGSEPFAATGTAGESALSLPDGASATAPEMCVDAGYPSFRFFSRASGGERGRRPVLRVDVLYPDSLGHIAIPAGYVTPTADWSPTPVLLTHAGVASRVEKGSADLRIRLTAVSGAWTVDDLFVDPYFRG